MYSTVCCLANKKKIGNEFSRKLIFRIPGEFCLQDVNSVGDEMRLSAFSLSILPSRSRQNVVVYAVNLQPVKKC